MSGAGVDGSGLGAASARGAAGEALRPFGKRPLLIFSLAVAVPALLLHACTAVLVFVALTMMAQEIDRYEEQRGVTLMAAALSSFLNGVSDAVSDEGTWNEAYLNVVVSPDPAWMDSTWGATARLGAHYDDVMVTDQSGSITFGENNLGAIRGDIVARYPAAAGMLTELDAAIGATGDSAAITHFASDSSGTAGLAAISIHRSTPGEATVPRSQRRILWIARHITPQILQDIARRYQMPLAQTVAEVPVGSSSVNIVDADGKIAGTLAWVPERPGEIAFRNVSLLVALALAGIGLVLVVGLDVLRRAIVRRTGAIEKAWSERERVAEIVTAKAAETIARPQKGETSRTMVDGVSATQFAVEYQPVFDLRSETMIAVETLLRWTALDQSQLLQENLSPADCAQMMERAGIMALRHAAGELGPLLGVTLSLSVTPAQILNPVFAEKIAGTLGATNFQMRRLQLHVDTTLLPDMALIAPRVAELRMMGITVALANFSLSEGTLPFLHAGFVDRICLARGMVAGIDTDAARFQLAQATIETARLADIAVTVPHIGRKEEATRLLRLGCREFRGPMLAKPMGIAALTALILAPDRAEPVRRVG